MNISFGSSELEFHWEEPARSTRANLNHPQYTQSQFRRKRPEPITFAIGWRFVFDFVGTIGPIAARRLKKLVFAIVDMGSFAHSCEVGLAACVGTACALAVCAPSALIIRPNAAGLESVRGTDGKIIQEAPLPDWANFRQRALDTAVAGINKKTDLNVVIESLVRSKHRRVTTVIFAIREQAVPNR
jgi:hypothetical protein